MKPSAHTWSHYRFHSVWRLPAPPDAVFAVLERAEEYPTWWPQVRSMTRLDDTSGVAVFRSFLPYGLTVTARERHRDPAAGVLEIGMTGDLDGWARWTLRAQPGGTRADYDQEVEVRKPLMRLLALPGRPVFLANHAWMMRGGRRGLASRLRSV
ncbi:SRPBCC family protein [Streptomyces beihaiensis]|uniref:SRPBCC family protein n=1 Tax=Streptomyces beihaiensis TaxID=2984495 RepID=A0ABT3TUK6_9ACTN|nr:SRPBCC family protein [Streptomyces beihaiensis]MCX3060722.1 SRPBCC family protein [Streptomyces beihaiensis]